MGEEETTELSVEDALAAQLLHGTEREPELADFENLTRHPLYFGISRPIGTYTKSITSTVTSHLEEAGYLVKRVKLSQLIARAYKDITGNQLPATLDGEERNFSAYRGLMRAGDALRVLNPAIVGKLAVLEINRRRDEVAQEALLSGRKGAAYLVTHLMHPAEVHTLRAVYGQRFFLIAANAPRQGRQAYLSEGFERELKTPGRGVQLRTDIGAEGENLPNAESEARKLARQLITIDAGIASSIKDLSPKGRLNVDDTFQLADLFVRSRAESHQERQEDKSVDNSVKHEISRFISQVFSHPFRSPTSEEAAMATAFLAARNSVALGRSVGAAIVDESGSVVSAGWNEVAKPLGGPYRENDSPDHRDHVNGFDPSDVSRIDAIQSFLRVLLSPSEWQENLASIEERYPDAAQWLQSLSSALSEGGLAPSRDAVAGLAGLESFDKTRIMHLIEFGRSVHAEMAALSDAFRRGVGAPRMSVYVTTFPCHECARNLVSFGVDRVVYVEPYGKSMAESLYGDEIDFFPEDSSAQNGKVKFIPYAGISPRRLDALFAPVPRKHGFSDKAGASRVGHTVVWSQTSAPIRPGFVDYPPDFDYRIVNPNLEVARLGTEFVVAASAAAELSRAELNFRDPDDSSGI